MKKKNKKKITEEWFEAVSNGDIETIQKMLDKGWWDVNGKWDINRKFHTSNEDSYLYGWTALHESCYWGYIEIAKLLIDNGADISIKNIYCETPLDILLKNNPKKYQELMEWITEKYPEKILEIMSEKTFSSQGIKGI